MNDRYSPQSSSPNTGYLFIRLCKTKYFNLLSDNCKKCKNTYFWQCILIQFLIWYISQHEIEPCCTKPIKKELIATECLIIATRIGIFEYCDYCDYIETKTGDICCCQEQNTFFYFGQNSSGLKSFNGKCTLPICMLIL